MVKKSISIKIQKKWYATRLKALRKERRAADQKVTKLQKEVAAVRIKEEDHHVEMVVLSEGECDASFKKLAKTPGYHALLDRGFLLHLESEYLKEEIEHQKQLYLIIDRRIRVLIKQAAAIKNEWLVKSV